MSENRCVRCDSDPGKSHATRTAAIIEALSREIAPLINRALEGVTSASLHLAFDGAPGGKPIVVVVRAYPEPDIRGRLPRRRA